jgi:two-component system sensor histidine kinase ChiS
MSGYDVCKKLRDVYSAQELPIIFLTARNQLNDLVTAFTLGANDFLHKPVAREELLARVYTHLQLLDVHRNLDQKVAERTLELDQKNQHLKQVQDHLKEVNKKLEEASLTDPLTGLRNRRFLNKFIGADTSIVARNYLNAQTEKGNRPEESDLVFMLLDLDHFKYVNDQHGHSAGDQVLEQLSHLLREVLRESDYLIRWGGEEFLLVMRFCLREQASEMAERIRQTIADAAFRIESGADLHITCSIGFAPYPFYTNNPTAISWEQVVDTADRALYAAKAAGRNCWLGIESGTTTDNASLCLNEDEDLSALAAEGKIKLLRGCDGNR